MTSKTRAERNVPTTGVLETVTGSPQEHDAKTMPLADAVEYLARKDEYTEERALSVVDDAITDGKLTINDAFVLGLE